MRFVVMAWSSDYEIAVCKVYKYRRCAEKFACSLACSGSYPQIDFRGVNGRKVVERKFFKGVRV